MYIDVILFLVKELNSLSLLLQQCFQNIWKQKLSTTIQMSYGSSQWQRKLKVRFIIREINPCLIKPAI